MERFVRTLFDKDKDWSAGGKSTIDLPLDRYISEIQLRAEFTYDTAASPTVAQDGVLNGIKRINLKRNGKTVRSWSPARYWYKHPLDLGKKPEFLDVTTSVANDKTAQFVLPIFLRLAPRNENDVTALLGAKYLSSAQIEIEWGAAGAFGTAQTITAGTVTTTLKELVLTRAEESGAYGRTGDEVVKQGTKLLELIEQEQTKPIDAAYGDFQFAMALPVGAVLQRSFLFATDNGARDDDIIDRLRVRQDAPVRVDYLEETWEVSQARDLQEYLVVDPISGNRYLTGFTVLDFLEFGGFDLRGRRGGEANLYATTTSPTGTSNAVLLHEQVQRVAL